MSIGLQHRACVLPLMGEAAISQDLVPGDISPNDQVEQAMRRLTNNPDQARMPEGVRHMGMVRYLEICWQSHRNAVLRPDIAWQTVLSCLACIVKQRPDNFRSLFTVSEEKRDIVVPGVDPSVLNLSAITREIAKLSPMPVEDMILDFSIDDEAAMYAQMASFADAASPFFNYMMFLCGIPRVLVAGKKEDWHAIVRRSTELSAMFADKKVTALMEGAAKFACNAMAVADGDEETAAELFKLERCGSGSQEEATGWFSLLLHEDPGNLRLPQNWPSGIAEVRYKIIDTNEDWAMLAGCLSSYDDGHTLWPQMGFSSAKVLPEGSVAEASAADREIRVYTNKIEASADEHRRLKGNWTFELGKPIIHVPYLEKNEDDK